MKAAKRKFSSHGLFIVGPPQAITTSRLRLALVLTTVVEVGLKPDREPIAIRITRCSAAMTVPVPALSYLLHWRRISAPDKFAVTAR